MLQWVSRLSEQLRHHKPRQASVLLPDETPRNEVEVTATGPGGALGDLTAVLTKKRLLLTNRSYTTEVLSIPLAGVTALESTQAGVRVAYRGAQGASEELWITHVRSPKTDVDWMGDEWWVQSVAAEILEETGRDVWKEGDPPWYRRDS